MRAAAGGVKAAQCPALNEVSTSFRPADAGRRAPAADPENKLPIFRTDPPKEELSERWV